VVAICTDFGLNLPFLCGNCKINWQTRD